MLNIPDQNQLGTLSKPTDEIVRLKVNGDRLKQDLTTHLNQELDNFIKNIDLNKYIEA
ncbi:hypothetical protein C672_1866 [[Clostridium] bifermentans ATCC 638]|uniref:Uncharacterized protein n=1 Tax=Paraclostridium bifermentans ATCC 638 = DSM 14991 TaxID=1233171 RepID=T4VQF8_PARBF|nr:hypothetical protein [Paraclostridium bifermentans]EQK42922.1 hypothetical protein C672_1866 [[Clostridium] bifermentans ATCC 638] [Paraclostridium bifermentans ATCC 638 = DSM 14991]UAG16805.1 hypothetical protein KXZ80_08370 [Paraclostridium bifermentans]